MLADVVIDNSAIDFFPEHEAVEILQNVRTICSTIKGTVPLDREFGIDAGIVDEPVNVARARISARIIAAVREFEPRADVVKVSFRAGNNQEVLPVVSIKLSQ